MGVGVVGEHPAGGDIGGDALRRVDPVAEMDDPVGIEEEDRLRHVARAKDLDQARGALVGGEEGAAAARHVVEAERDALGRLGRRRRDHADRALARHHHRQRDAGDHRLEHEAQPGHRPSPLVPAVSANRRWRRAAP